MVPLCYQWHTPVRHPTAPLRRVFSFGVIALGAALAGCSPTFNWRTVELSPGPWQAMLPCKPERAERPVPLTDAQSPTVLKVASCEAAGLTFALAHAELADPAQSPAALQRWQRATWAGLRQTPTEAGQAPAGWTQWPVSAETGLVQAIAWRGPGVGPQGEAVQAQLLWVAQGRWLLQAAVYSPGSAPAEAVDTFFAGLRGSRGAP